jgi:peptidoglycan/LPS O-acetylase OafA/YrhL
LKYRAEIDGLRALAVIPVILFHAGFELFSGGFVGVDVFFVISGYLITTILINDLDKNRFSIVNFYERRARRILPALFFVIFVTSIVSYFYLMPTDLREYARSLIYVIGFLSNVFFWKESDYFATESELTPLLHMWSLAVEEQYYVIFPIFLILTWRFGKNKVFWIIVAFALISLALSEWGWRNKATANFYLAPTRAWELFAGSISAFIVQKRGERANNILSMFGLAAIIFAIFFYDKNTPFPSVYALVPVLGVVLIILFAQKNTFSAKILSNKLVVGIGLISYSAYLIHQPLFALVRHNLGVNLEQGVSLALILLTLVLAVFSWRFVEQPFRSKNRFGRKFVFSSSLLIAMLFVLFSLLVIYTDGAKYRFLDFPDKPLPWKDIKCHGAKQISVYSDPVSKCLGGDSNGVSGDIYLVGDSHSAQLTFALKNVANNRERDFYFINTEDKEDYPYSFWNKSVSSDRLLEHILNVADEGDIFVTSFHRGRLNDRRDSHIKIGSKVENNKKPELFYENLVKYIPRFSQRGINVFLVKDGPLLADKDTSLEACMYKYTLGEKDVCPIEISQDTNTRNTQSILFDSLSEKFNNVVSLDYLPILYGTNDVFSPISKEGVYLMFDRHHLTEDASLRLIDFFDQSIYSSSEFRQ